MTTARIYQPAKTAMQSGHAQTRQWRLEFEPAEARRIEPLMGWCGSADIDAQVSIRFETKAQAIAFAKRHGIAYQVDEPKAAKLKIKSYADNFAYHRVR